MMRVRLTRPAALEPSHLHQWRQLQADHPALDRPFFCPEYLATLAEVRSDLEVAVLESGGRVAGFFPFHRLREGTGRPPGLRICDFQGLVAPPDLQVDPEMLLRECGLHSWTFDHLLEEQVAFRPWHLSRRASPYIDLSRGYDGYLAERKAAGANWVSQVPRKARKFAREVGELRFEYDDPDRSVLVQLLHWKSEQRRQTVTYDVLEQPWVTASLERFLGVRGPGFACVVSALYAGPHLVAAHLGLRSRRTLHLWFPAFNREFEAYSPGLLLFTELFRAAAACGIERVDLGKGSERYKQSMASASTCVAEGGVETRFLRRWFGRAYHACREGYRAGGIDRVFRGPKRRLKQLTRRLVPVE
jgi:CelD/BcsL family acetyltransferase involved in cellulose biosynthesis